MRARVLFIQQYFYPDISAVSQLLGDLTLELARTRKYHLTVLCSSEARPSTNAMPNRLDGVAIRRVPVPRRGGNGAVVSILQTAVFHLGVFLYLSFSRRFDVVVAMTSPPLVGFTTTLAIRSRRTKLIYYIEDLYPEILFDSRVVRRTTVVKKLSIFNRIVLRRADRTIAIGEYVARKLYCNYGITRRQVEVIPNWAKAVHCQEPKTPSKLIILYSGNLGFAHDLSLLPALIASLRDVDVEYRFIGSGRQFHSAEKIFASAREDRVAFQGYVDLTQHSQMLASASLFLVAQSWRTVGDLVPSKFYSYLAAGRPMIFLGPARSEIGELIQRHDLGATIEIPDDLPPARDKIARYLKDSSYYSRTCAAAARVYRDFFGAERSAASFISVLDDMVQKS